MGQAQFKMAVIVFCKDGIAPVIGVRIARFLFKKVHEQCPGNNFGDGIPGAFPTVFQFVQEIKKFWETFCDNAFDAVNDNFALFGCCGFSSLFS